MRTCTKCKKEKPLDSFAIKRSGKNGRQAHCKACHSIYMKKHYKANKKYYINKAKKSDAKFFSWYRGLKDNKQCTDCKKKWPAYVLHFDHLDPSTKKANVAVLAANGSKKKIQEEIKKCELVCANCHAERTHARLA